MKAIATNFSCLESISLDAVLSGLTVFPLESGHDCSAISSDKVLIMPSRIANILDGVVEMYFAAFKGVKGCMHSKGAKLLAVPLSQIMPFNESVMDGIINTLGDGASLSEKQKKSLSDLTLVDVLGTYCNGFVATNSLRLLLRHLHPSNMAEFWIRILGCVQLSSKLWDVCFLLDNVSLELLMCLILSSSNVIEMLIFALHHSGGRALSCESVTQAISSDLVNSILDFSDKCFSYSRIKFKSKVSRDPLSSLVLFERSRVLFCIVWRRFQRNRSLVKRLNVSIKLALEDTISETREEDGIRVLIKESFPHLPVATLQEYLFGQIFKSICAIKLGMDNAKPNKRQLTWLSLTYQVLMKVSDNRPLIDFEEHGMISDKNKHIGNETKEHSYHGDTLISDCTEIQSIIEGCFEVVNNIRCRWDSSDGVANASLAVMCLQWFSDIQPHILKRSQNEKRVANFLNYCKDSLFKEFASRIESGFEKNELLLSKVISLFFSLSKVFPQNNINATFAKTSLLGLLLNVLSHKAKSIGNVMSMCHVLNYISTESGSSNGILTHQQEITLINALSNALETPSFWLRLYILKVLRFTLPPTIALHSGESAKNVRSTGDHEANMDDEDDMMIQQSHHQMVDVFRICWEATCLPASLATEREFIRLLGQLEVLVKSGLLDSMYILSICSFCLGLLHYKFKPFWEPCIKVVTAITETSDGEELVWPQVLNAVKQLSMKCPGVSEPRVTLTAGDEVLEGLVFIINNDDGEDIIPFEVSNGPSFSLSVKSNQNQNNRVVLPDERADSETVFSSVWDIFRKSPVITLRHSKTVVPMFMKFLNEQYYDSFSDDPDVPFLLNEGILTEKTDASVEYPSLPCDLARKRLVLFLEVFAAVSSPKQLYQHQVLWTFYSTILSKPEINIVNLALKCMFAYKEPFLNPYKEPLSRLLSDSSFRDEMLVFDISEDSAIIMKDHRKEFIPLLSRIVYSRFSTASRGKSEKAQAIARRHAVLSFIATLPSNELETFIYHMTRGLIPQKVLVEQCSRLEGCTWSVAVENMTHHLPPDFMLNVPVERQVGFLHVLGYAVKICGFKLKEYIPLMNKLLTSMSISSQHNVQSKQLESSSEGNETEDEDGDETEDLEDVTSTCFVNTKQVSRIRTMCLLRFTDLVHQYSDHIDFSSTMSTVCSKLAPLFEALPRSINGSTTSKPPALLKLVQALVQYEKTISIVASNEDIVQVIISCISSDRVSTAIVSVIMEIISSLLHFRNGSVILKYSGLVITSFSRRFLGRKGDVDSIANIKLSDLRINPTGSVREELNLLASIATNYLSKKNVEVDCQAISNLTVLLLGMIRTYTTTKKVRVDESWMLNILKTYGSLLWRVKDVRGHVGFVSRLFGPASHSLSLFNSNVVRKQLIEVYKLLASHQSTMDLLLPCSRAIEDLVAMDENVVESRDFARCMPIFQSLADNGTDAASEGKATWNNIMGPAHCSPRDASLCSAVLFECLRSMYDSEIVIRSAAVAALKRLLDVLMFWSVGCGTDELEGGEKCPEWLEPLHSVIVPALHRGLKNGSDQVKKGFVGLLSHLIRQYRVVNSNIESNGVQLHEDLFVLLHDDIEQDFFENIFHIQLHRRGKAMNKLRILLEEKDKEHFGNATIVHVLLPLALHPLECEDFKKKDHLTLLNDSSLLVAAVAKNLPWNQYFNLIRRILKMLDVDRCDKEKVLLTALCGVLDSFHFDLSSSSPSEEHLEEEEDGEDQNIDEVPETAVMISKEKESKQQIIANRITQSVMPWVKVYLIKESTDNKGVKSSSVRTLVAVALAKLLKRLHPPVISIEKKNTIFLNLVMTVVSTLKSKNSAARDAARDSLSKMILTMGMDTLKVVLYELNHSLTSGYQRHVRNYTARSILSTVLEDYSADSTAFSIPISNTSPTKELIQSFADKIIVPEFDKCIPLLVEFSMDDINGITNEDRETKDDVARTLIREAKGNKANDILEMCGKCILFRPTYALIPYAQLNLEDCSFVRIPAPSSSSSVHSLVSPLLQTLNGDDELTNSVIGRISEALQRLALGISKNSSFSATELLLYVHATLHPFVTKILKDINTHRREMGGLDEYQDSVDFSQHIPSYLKDFSDDENDTPLYGKRKHNDDVSKRKAKTWLPMDKKSSRDQREVVERRDMENRALLKVEDGASAPKLTGRNSHKSGVRTSQRIESDKAFASSVKFCLTLLHSCLKQSRLNSNDEETRTMAAPFLPLLFQCLRLSENSGVVLLSMRCICALLGWGISMDFKFCRSLGKCMLNMMVHNGATLSADNDLVQACIKGLTSLFQIYNKGREESKEESRLAERSSDAHEMAVMSEDEAGEDGIDNNSNKRIKERMPLDGENIRSLISLLSLSMTDISSTYQNSAFQLIRAIIDARVLVPEIYDLIDRLIDQVVLSHRKGVREAASSTVISFLFSYPLGKKRMLSHFKKLLQNCNYEFEEGRYSALLLMSDFCKRLPSPVLDEFTNLIFMPMSLQVVNDMSGKCRSCAGDVLVYLTRRCSTDKATSCLTYALNWLGVSNWKDSISQPKNKSRKSLSGANENIAAAEQGSIEIKPIIRTGAQVLSLIVVGRPDMVKKSKCLPSVFGWLRRLLFKLVDVDEGSDNKKRNSLQRRELSNPNECEGEGDASGVTTWSILYHSLLLLEKLFKCLPGETDAAVLSQKLEPNLPFLLDTVQETLLYPHVWVRSVSCRILELYVKRRDPKLFLSKSPQSEGDILLQHNGLYNFARRLCVALNQPELPEGLFQPLCSCIVFAVRALYHAQGDKDISSRTIDETDASQQPEGANWAIQRLRGIGADSRGSRRLHVIKVCLLPFAYLGLFALTFYVTVDILRHSDE